MGCDIHAMIERRATHKGDSGEPELWPWWINSGDPDLNRDYTLFGILAGVRDDSVTPISEPRGIPEDASSVMKAWHESWGVDAHSASFVTLSELVSYDMSAVDEWGRKAIKNLIRQMRVHMKGMPTIAGIGERRVKDESVVRLVFFFDN
jgi:hypothetical protein